MAVTSTGKDKRAKTPMSANHDSLLNNYRTLLLIRRFEERVEALFADSMITGTCHLCIGQEAAAVGVANALLPGDQVVSCHRGHGHLLAMGADPVRLLGEMMGKEIGYCRGRGGSQHLSVPDIGFLGTNGITGGGIPIATGAALTARQKDTGAAVVCFFGDGATSQGAFHESLNIASLWKLPVLYVCENNRYAMSTPIERTVAGGDLLARARAYAMPCTRVDGMDADVVQKGAAALLADIRAGQGPAFLEAVTYRYCGHSKSDRLVYRTREEEAEWRAHDPIPRARAQLEQAGLAARADEVEAEVADLLQTAEQKCAASPDADPGEAEQGVYADA